MNLRYIFKAWKYIGIDVLHKLGLLECKDNLMWISVCPFRIRSNINNNNNNYREPSETYAGSNIPSMYINTDIHTSSSYTGKLIQYQMVCLLGKFSCSLAATTGSHFVLHITLFILNSVLLTLCKQQQF